MKHVLICLFAIGGALISSNVVAQQEPFACPERPDKPAKARKEAGTYFAEAETAYTEERYLQSLEKFGCSLVMVEHENTIINIEKTLAQIARPDEALPILTAVLAQMDEGPLKTRVSEIAAKMEAELAERTQAEAAAACPETPVAPPPECPPAELLELESESTEEAHKLLLIGGWTGVGIGAASFISAIVFQAVAGSAKNRAQEAVSYPVFLDERDKNRSFQTAATVAFVGSALTAGVGIVQLLLLSEQQQKYREKKNNTAPSSAADAAPKVSFIPGIGRIGMEVTF